MTGSSPLARGKWTPDTGSVDDTGFIPTRAGKMPALLLQWRARPVHPHSRGENSRSQVGDPSQGGSSPLARGKL